MQFIFSETMYFPASKVSVDFPSLPPIWSSDFPTTSPTICPKNTSSWSEGRKEGGMEGGRGVGAATCGSAALHDDMELSQLGVWSSARGRLPPPPSPELHDHRGAFNAVPQRRESTRPFPLKRSLTRQRVRKKKRSSQQELK